MKGMNGEDVDYLLKVYDETYPGFRKTLRSLSVPTTGGKTKTPGQPAAGTSTGSVWLQPGTVYGAIGLSMIICTATVGVMHNWFVAVAWLAVMSFVAVRWQRWAVS